MRDIMLAMELRPSIKIVKLGYILCLLMAVAIAVYQAATQNQEPRIWAAMILPGVLVLFVVIRHIRRRLTKLTILGDVIRYESGLFSKSTRTEQLVKIQDIRVDQTFSQRLIGVGDLSMETAGGSSRVMMRSIDSPQAAADHLLGLVRSQRPQAL